LIVTRPAVARLKPHSAVISVDLPAPLPPTIATNSHGSIESVVGASSCLSPIFRSIPVASSRIAPRWSYESRLSPS
jgi:hypothetical protein